MSHSAGHKYRSLHVSEVIKKLESSRGKIDDVLTQWGGWTRFAKHDGAIDRFELSCNEPSYCADLEEQKKIQLQELEITKMEVSPILVV